VAPLGFGERQALSYGAVYHPWLIESGEVQPFTFRRTPPEGAACGVLALRAATRGAWIAPANELLRQVIALTPAIGPDYWLALQDAHLNLVRQEARGFLILSADTLSEDAALRPIGVRRLLILLRRLALRLGASYVFEPNGDAFRRLVQRGFEALLGQMFVRGAFAGATATAAFQVVVATTPQDEDNGRFIVELRVAPSLPLTFLTIRLVQAGDRALLTEEL
jgi:phage tail sheath protein FI